MMRHILPVGLSILCLVSAAFAEPPKASDLPSIKELPDPFLMNDGSRVKTKEDWNRRRSELRELILYYQYGRIPPAPGNVKGEVTSSNRDEALNATVKQILLTMGPNSGIATHLELTIPTGPGPFPVIITGDLSWGKIKQPIVAEVINRGYILVEFNRTEVAADSKDRPTGIYPAYPDYDCGAVAAWAWGFHRVVDYLLTQKEVDAQHIAITGHSRGGKAALLAGALDERIALTAPNNSGCGGAGCYRFQAEKSEEIHHILKSFPFWFTPRFADFIGQVDRLPIDQHSIKALVAPRALLQTEALGDLWANPQGTQLTYQAAKQVYDWLGASNRIGVYYREGKHEQGFDDWKVLLDFADRQFFGKSGERAFDKVAFPDAPKAFEWSAPK